MCGRFGLFSSIELIKKMMQLDDMPLLSPRYNIAPSQPVAGVRAKKNAQEREMILFRWGLIPFWSKEGTAKTQLINAKSETIYEKAVFRSLITRNRCLIPADGFYEWKTEGKKKQPYFIQFTSGEPFAFAGLWDQWKGPEGPVLSCTILTTEANDAIKPIHDRMPVIVNPDDYATWLYSESKSRKELEQIFQPYNPEEIESYPVAMAVNSPANDDPRCIEKIQINDNLLDY